MGVRNQLEEDVKTAMRQGDAETRDTLRLLLAAIKQVEIDDQVQLDDEGVLKVISKQAKQRRESIKDAEAAGRPDLVEQPRRSSQLPSALSTRSERPVCRIWDA